MQVRTKPMHVIDAPADELDSDLSRDLVDAYGAPRRCNEFAFWYQRENPHAVVKLGRVGTDEKHSGDWHVWVYDPELDATIDLTMRQFDGHEDFWTEGDEHPSCYEHDQYESREPFVDEWDFGMESPFHIEN
jgi:hypothetical protein